MNKREKSEKMKAVTASLQEEITKGIQICKTKQQSNNRLDGKEIWLDVLTKAVDHKMYSK